MPYLIQIEIVNSIQKITFFVFLLLSGHISGQEKPWIIQELEKDSVDDGHVVIYQNENITKTLAQYTIYKYKEKKGIHVYRIRLFRGSGKEARAEADRLRLYMQGRFPALKIGQEFQNDTDWVVYIGNFLQRSEAKKILDSIVSEFPDVYMVKETIPLSKL